MIWERSELKKVFELYDIFTKSHINPVNLFRNIRIQTRLIGSFFILSFVPLLITGYFSYYKSSSAIEAKIKTYSEQLMNHVSRNIEYKIEKLVTDSEELIYSDTIQNGLEDYDGLSDNNKLAARMQIHTYVSSKSRAINDIRIIYIYTEAGEEVYNKILDNQENVRKQDIDSLNSKVLENKNSVHFNVLKQVNEYKASDISKNNQVVISRAIRSRVHFSNVIGIFHLSVYESYLSNIYKNVDIGKGADLFIIDSKGIVMSSINPEIVVGEAYGNSHLILNIGKTQDDGKQTFPLSTKNGKYLAAYSPIADTDWYIVSTIPFSNLNYESRNIGLNIAYLGLGCFLLAILLSYIISMSISYPLKNLVKKMNEAQKGNLSVRIIDNNRDELAEATWNFNRMVNEISILLTNIKNKENQKRAAELKALQAQINPHFLYNTLNTIKWLAGVQKAENVSNLVNSLLQLLHVSMGKGSEFITVREEIEYIGNYVNIQEYRYCNKFKIHMDIEEAAMELKIPRFILQPIVENSLIHGIGPMEGQGLISIKVYFNNGKLKITVTDNGVGMLDDKVSNILTDGADTGKARFSGIGIKNVDERIKLYFGEEYGIHIESIPNLYTTVEVLLPVVNDKNVE